MNTVHKISLDFTQSGIRQRVNAVQGDSYARSLEIAMYENAVAWDMPVGASAFLRYRKPDGTGGIYDTLPNGTQAWSAQGNLVRFALAPQILSVPGVVRVQMEIVSGAVTLATFAFLIEVEEDPSLGVIPSEDYVSWNAWAMQALENLFLVGDSQPDAVPALWFDTSPQGPGTQVTVLDRQGNGTQVYPITKSECVEDLPETLAGKAPAGYGFGEASADISGRDLLAVMAEGKTRRCQGSNVTNAPMAGFAWFYIDCDSEGYGIVHVWYHGNKYHCVATYSSGALSEWEWDNPPMAPGVEYRTAERWNGEAVYRKLVSYTTAAIDATNSQKDCNIPHGITNFKKLVYCQATKDSAYQFPYLAASMGGAGVNKVDGSNIVFRVVHDSYSEGTLYFDLKYTKSA